MTRARSSTAWGFEVKALVISNCATKAYIQGMQLLFPGWEIRGVRDKGAAQFVEEGKKNSSSLLSISMYMWAAQYLSSLITFRC